MEQTLVRRPVGLLVTSAILAAFTVYASLRSQGIMEHHRQLLEAWGAPIPPFTEFVLNGPNFWWVIAAPAVAVFVWIALASQITPTQKSRMKMAVVGVIVFGAAIYGAVAYAFYAPIYEMGNSI